MDFDHLTKEPFEQIISYLPLEEQIRIERVSKRFQEISQNVISKVKSIDSTKDLFQRMNDVAISKLFRLCKSNLEEIKIDEQTDTDTETENENCRWTELFATFSCPRLVKLHIICSNDDDNDLIKEIMAKNRNLKNVCWSGLFIIPENIVFEKLEQLEIIHANDDTFRALIGKCPNLKCFEILNCDVVDGETFDSFFSTVSNLEKFRIEDDDTTFRFDRLINFWRLSSMRSLDLRRVFITFDDDDLEKMADSFPRLEKLCLDWIKLEESTNRGLIALSSLRNLRHIRLCSMLDRPNIDLGTKRLIENCEHLEFLDLPGLIMSATLIALVHHCRELRYLEIYDIVDVTTVDEAVTVVKSFDGEVKKNISICICASDDEIWNSDDVKNVLEELTADGHVIKINDHRIFFELSDIPDPDIPDLN